MQSYTFRPCCTVDDAAAIAHNNVSAFWTQTWWRMLFNAPVESVVAAVAARTPHKLVGDREIYRHQAVVDPATGDLVGYARWILPREHAAAWTEAQAPNVEEADAARFKAEFDATRLPQWKDEKKRELDELDVPVEEQQAKLKPKEPYMKLDYLATHPDHQKRGISSMLVKSGIEQADRLGLKIYVLAKGHVATGLYKKLGFNVEWDLSQSLKRWGYDDECYTAILIRPPSKEQTADL